MSRDYDPRGRPTMERIAVRGSAELATAFGYNGSGWLDEILYPGSGAGRLTRVHRPDGVVSEQRWGAQGQEVPLVVYEYRGNRERRRRIHQFDGVSLVVGVTTLYARGWSASASWTLASDPQQEVFSDEVARNGAGLITSRRQPNGLWSYLDHDGPNWVVSERWNVDAADPTGGDSWVEHEYTRSSYGEVTQVEELGPTVPSGETNIWSYSRDDAGFFGAIGDQVLRYNEDHPNLAPEFIEHLMRDRQHSIDDAGNEHLAQFVFESFESSSPYVETTTWAYTSDAWGRVIEAERTRSRAGSPDKVGIFRFTHDAFGRLVSHQTETQNDPLVEIATVHHALHNCFDCCLEATTNLEMRLCPILGAPGAIPGTPLPSGGLKGLLKELEKQIDKALKEGLSKLVKDKAKKWVKDKIKKKVQEELDKKKDATQESVREKVREAIKELNEEAGVTKPKNNTQAHP